MKTSLSSDQYYELECMIDKSNMSTLLEAIRQICAEKAEHVETAWQDKALAKEWKSLGRKIDNLRKGLWL